MDGTLIDSSALISGAINHVRTQLGLKALDKDLILKNINDPHIDAAPYFYGTPSFTQEQYDYFDAYYNQNLTKEVYLYEGIADLLQELSKTKTLCVATNASEKYAHELLKALNVASYFTHIVGVNGTHKPKPAPDMLEHIISLSGTAKKDAVLIGDSQKDLLAAQHANIDSRLVGWGFSTYEDAIDDVEGLKKSINI